MEFVRWATGADDPRPWWANVLAGVILVAVAAFLVLRGLFRD